MALLFALPAWLWGQLRPGVRILMYHRVSPSPEFEQLTVTPERFREQMQILQQRFEVISLGAAVEYLQSGKRLKRALSVVTFDDGYLDNLTEALPILEEFNIPATIFVSTDFCAQSASHPRYAAQADSETLHLDWEQVRALAQHPLITIGSHTQSHAFLPRVEDEQAHAEILQSAEQITAELGMPVDFFCYPNGDYGERELRILQHSNYRAALTVQPGVNVRSTSMLELRRTEVTDKDSSLSFKLKLLGAFDWVHALLHLRRERNYAQLARRSNA